MKRDKSAHIRKTASIALAIVLGLTLTGQAARAVERTDDDIDYAVLAEDLQIMGRVLAKSVASQYERIGTASNTTAPFWGSTPDDEQSKMALSYYIAAGTAFRVRDAEVRGFYVPGSGAVFTMDLQARTKLIDAQPTEHENAKTDLWDETEQELHRGDRANDFLQARKKTPQQRVLDPAAIQAIIDVLTATVAQHGSRIEQLGAGDSITVAVRVAPGMTSVTTGESSWYATLVTVGGDVEPMSIVIQIPVATVRDFANGRLDLETLKARTRVTRY